MASGGQRIGRFASQLAPSAPKRSGETIQPPVRMAAEFGRRGRSELVRSWSALLPLEQERSTKRSEAGGF